MRRAAAEADEHPGGAGAHEVQRRGVGRRAADDDRDVQLVDEPLEVERFGATGHVLGADRRPADDEQVAAGVDDGLPVLLRPLRAERAGDRDARLPDLAQPLRDELGLDVLGVDLLHPRGRLDRFEADDLLEQRLRVLVAGPQPLEVEDRQAAELAERDGGLAATSPSPSAPR